MPLSSMRALRYIQIDYFQLWKRCVEKGLLKRTRRKLPMAGVEASAGVSFDAVFRGEEILFRLAGQALRSLFHDCRVEKVRDIPAFRIALPRGDWWKEGNGTMRGALEPQGEDTNFISLTKPSAWGNGHLILEVAFDRMARRSRFARRRCDTIMRDGKPRSNSAAALSAAIRWRGCMAAALRDFHQVKSGEYRAVGMNEQAAAAEQSRLAFAEEAERWNEEIQT